MSQSRPYRTPEKNPKESPADYELRTWRERMHYDDAGKVFIPPMAFKWCITEAAQFLGQKIVGRGSSRYTKHFKSGILVLEGMPLGIDRADVPGEELFVPSDGVHGGGSRVYKTFPLISEWSGKVTFHILDRIITREVFEEHLREAGRFIGIGRFRPQVGGYYGRFTPKTIKWSED